MTDEFLKRRIPTSARIPGADPNFRRALDHIEEETNRASPWSAWQRVQVTFSATANADTVIPHLLDPDDPENVEWFITSLEIPFLRAYNQVPPPDFPPVTTVPVIYRPAAFDRRSWATDYIVLRSNVASLQATLLLCIPRVVSSAARQ